MTFKLTDASIALAIQHLKKYGDTDVFPHLPEIAFLADCEDEIIAELAALDLDTFTPSNAVEALAPKSKLGFRIVHQLPCLDTVLLLAAVIEIGPQIEALRPDTEEHQAFSYRFLPDGEGGLFSNDATYKSWLHHQLEVVKSNLKIKQVVVTDISDFYARVNFHRLENLLDAAAPKSGAVRYIKKHIKTIRAKQSFGLPVGGSAARLLAELALSDTDRALKMDGVLATRYVDDFRIFLTVDQDPYDVLALLAEHLGINEGLSLNVAKTAVYSKSEYLERLQAQTTDVKDESFNNVLETLVANIYSEEFPDPDEVEQLAQINLLELLQDEINKDSFDMGRIKFIFRALRVAKPYEAIDFIIQNFGELVVFSRELVLLMEELAKDHHDCFDGLHDEVLQVIQSPPASSIQLLKTWLVELLVRGVIEPQLHCLKAISLSASTPIDKRQLLLIAGRLDDTNYFRKHKTAFNNFSPFEQLCLIWGASCLPTDEFKSWLAHVKPYLSAPLGEQYLKWVLKNKDGLVAKLGNDADDHPQ